MEDLKKLRCIMLKNIILPYKNKNLNDNEFLNLLCENETRNLFKKIKYILLCLPSLNLEIEIEDISSVLNIIENRVNNIRLKKTNIEELATNISLNIRFLYLILEKLFYLYEKKKERLI